MNTIVEQPYNRFIGLALISAFIFYGVGNVQLESGQFLVGGILVGLNSAVVISLGIMIRKTIQSIKPSIGMLYFWGRILEGTLLGVGATCLILGYSELNRIAYYIAMACLAVVSLPFCFWLTSAQTVFRILGHIGIIGYVGLLSSVLAGVFGFYDLEMMLLIPGAAFEIGFALIMLFNLKIKIPTD
jgi:hypothetical protein